MNESNHNNNNNNDEGRVCRGDDTRSAGSNNRKNSFKRKFVGAPEGTSDQGRTAEEENPREEEEDDHESDDNGTMDVRSSSLRDDDDSNNHEEDSDDANDENGDDDDVDDDDESVAETTMSTEESKRNAWFLEYCNFFRCNRRDIYKVVINQHVVPVGCLQQICDAVSQNNTYIEEVVVDVSTIHMEKLGMDCAWSLIDFIGTSTKLRKVEINAEILDEDPTDPRAELFASKILDAIQVNKSIEELAIVGYCSCVSFQLLMSSSMSIKTLNVNCDFLNDEDTDRRDRFFHALTFNHSIDNLCLRLGDESWYFLESIPVHIGNGPTTLRSLTLDCCQSFPEYFYTLLSTTKSLQTLELISCGWDEESSTPEQRALLMNAFAANTSIVHLKLQPAFDNDSDDDLVLFNKILRQLHNGPSTLRQLSLISCTSGWDLLQQYLSTSSAAMLQQLELVDCELAVNSLDCLVEGFRVLDSNPFSTTTMTRLKLNSCYLTESSLQQLIEFITARAKCHFQHTDDWSALTLLPNLDCVDMAYPPPELPYCGIDMGNVIQVSLSTTELLSPSDGATSTSIAHATVLSMRPSGNVPAFCDAFMATASMSSLVCLLLSEVGQQDCVKLTLWLSRTTSLRALHLVDIQDDVIPTTILNGLKRNGSLLTTAFVRANSQPFFQDTHHRSVMQAYCQRNRFLLEMTLNKVAFGNKQNGPNQNIREDNGNRYQLVLLPTLFHAANAIPLTRPRFFIAALLALGLAVGQRG